MIFLLKPSVLALTVLPKGALLAEPDTPTVSKRQLSSVLLMQIHHDLHTFGDISQTDDTLGTGLI